MIRRLLELEVKYGIRFLPIFRCIAMRNVFVIEVKLTNELVDFNIFQKSNIGISLFLLYSPYISYDISLILRRTDPGRSLIPIWQIERMVRQLWMLQAILLWIQIVLPISTALRKCLYKMWSFNQRSCKILGLTRQVWN